MVKKKPEHGAADAPVNEKILSELFDYQKFENEPSLAALIDETEHRYGSVIPNGARTAGRIGGRKFIMPA